MRKPSLHRALIVEAALELIDEAGIERLSMRRLGARLGVEAMALYHHVPSKGALLDAVQERLLDDVEVPPRDTAAPLDRLRAMISSYRAVAVRHPRAFLLLAARRFNTERAFDVYEAILTAFADAGLDDEMSARWFRLMGGFATGAGMAEVASRELISDATPLRLQRDPASIAHPHVRAVASYLTVDGLDAVFEAGLDVLFDALARQLAPPSPQRSAERGAPAGADRDPPGRSEPST